MAGSKSHRVGQPEGRLAVSVRDAHHKKGPMVKSTVERRAIDLQELRRFFMREVGALAQFAWTRTQALQKGLRGVLHGVSSGGCLFGVTSFGGRDDLRLPTAVWEFKAARRKGQFARESS
jgi:hypothetical protein